MCSVCLCFPSIHFWECRYSGCMCMHRKREKLVRTTSVFYVTTDLRLDGVEGEGIMYVARNWRGIFGMRLRVDDA